MAKRARRSATPHESLSRFASFVLRHDPASAGLTLDAEGWVPLAELLAAVRRQLPEWREATANDLHAMIAASEKKRHEIREGRIRALYGHSKEQGIDRKAEQPPDVLYHGTAPDSVALIQQDGLRAMSRQNVHLSVDVATAVAVGRRHLKGRHVEPVILRVDAGRAHTDGVLFYRGNDMTWLADEVPGSYLTILVDS